MPPAVARSLRTWQCMCPRARSGHLLAAGDRGVTTGSWAVASGRTSRGAGLPVGSETIPPPPARRADRPTCPGGTQVPHSLPPNTTTSPAQCRLRRGLLPILPATLETPPPPIINTQFVNLGNRGKFSVKIRCQMLILSNCNSFTMPLHGGGRWPETNSKFEKTAIVGFIVV